MFTGIIQAVGSIQSATTADGDVKLRINCDNLDMHDVIIGDSIAVNGVCLTVTNFSAQDFEAHVSKETLSVTAGLDPENLGRAVNLEKALRLSDRLGGHLVSGHVDGIAIVLQFERLGDCWKLTLEAPPAISKYIATKGSVCINGVSLTVNAVSGNVFTMNLIPHTLSHTNLQFLVVGSRVNLEIDQIARYVERMTEWATDNPK